MERKNGRKKGKQDSRRKVTKANTDQSEHFAHSCSSCVSLVTFVHSLFIT
jgi:hypothetical protein